MTGNSNVECDSCVDINLSNRDDFAAVNGTCPCTRRFYDIGVPTCVACHYTCEEWWFIIFFIEILTLFL